MGRGRDGQIGRGDQLESVAQQHEIPTRVDFFHTRQLRVNDISLGANHSLAIVSPRSSS